MMEASLATLAAWLIWFDLISPGAGVGCPSSPLCYRKSSDAIDYICEWNMNGSDNVNFRLSIEEFQKQFDRSPVEIAEEEIICRRPVNISVEAFDGNSSCSSPITTVVLKHVVKFPAPQNIRFSWSGNSVNLTWMAPENSPASAEVWYRQYGHPADIWKKLNTTVQTLGLEDVPSYQASLENFAKNISYQLRLRHQSRTAQKPLWSDWSPVVIVPAELTHKPVIVVSSVLEKDERKVSIKWNPKQAAAAAVQGVTYVLWETIGCPCQTEKVHNTTQDYVTSVSKSSVFISVIAKNTAGSSPRAIQQVPLDPAQQFENCSDTFLEIGPRAKTCLELYPIQNGGLEQDHAITITKKTMKMRQRIKDNIRYLCVRYRCRSYRPEVQACVAYQKEGVPRKEPQDFIGSSYSQTSANLSWREIPIEDQQGFVTHYHLCSVKIGSQDEHTECHNISASRRYIGPQMTLEYQLKNLVAGEKYNISVAGVTRGGKGPAAATVIQTLPDIQSVNVWIALVYAILIILAVLILVFKKFQGRILPPVPKPIIHNFDRRQAGNQTMSEKLEAPLQQEEEQVHEFTLHQKPPEDTHLGVVEQLAMEETWGYTDSSHETCSNPELTELDDAEETKCDLVEAQLTSLLYKRGLVFDEAR
ncbi:uncharacterized protein il12rb1 isoform X2 [Synchiropus splendidus]|uniref:uncharacterized protein il12rb1 isoform X2 n=1 Tax=Synchiropus splendidus TaxID=270530 RepID=UPI00237EB015|nr:uncharacterized protein il12rb1 isoform X2 [Synchiropus splendidus]